MSYSNVLRTLDRREGVNEVVLCENHYNYVRNAYRRGTRNYCAVFKCGTELTRNVRIRSLRYGPCKGMQVLFTS